MGKRRDRKSGSAKKRSKRRPARLFEPGFSAVPISGEAAAAFMESARAAGGVVYGPERLALIGRVVRAVDDFDYEVTGRTEPDLPISLLGGGIGEQLWERHGADADFCDLDVDALMDGFGWAPESLRDRVHTSLTALLTWLSHNGHLRPEQAIAMLERMQQRESPAVSAMRATVAALPAAEQERSERQRLQRVREMRLELN